MHDSIEIGKVPGKVLSETFKYRVEGLTAPFQAFGYDNTSAPKKKKGGKGMEAPDAPEGPPDAYFKVAIQFFGSDMDATCPLVYPPIGKHIQSIIFYVLAKFFYRGELSVLPGVFTKKEQPDTPYSTSPPASSSFTSFAAREPSHVLTDLNTGWGVGWKKAGGGPSLMLDKACPFSTLQLAPRACAKGKKAQSVYAIAPFLTALGTNQRVMLAERLTLLPCDDAMPTSSLFLALSVKNMETDLVRDPTGAFIDAVRMGDFHLPLNPRLPANVTPLLQSVHNFVTMGLFDIMSWTIENRVQLLSNLRRVVALTLSDCENIGEVPHSPMSIYNNPTYNSAHFTFNNGSKFGETRKEKKEKREKVPKTPEQLMQAAKSKEDRKEEKKKKDEKKAKKQQAKDEKKALKAARQARIQQEQQLLQEQTLQHVLQQRQGGEAPNEIISNLGNMNINSLASSDGTPDPSFPHPILPVTSHSAPSTPVVSSQSLGPSSSKKKGKQPHATCMVCHHKYIGLYEGHVTSKEHLTAVTRGIDDKAQSHEAKIAHITSVLQQSPNKQFNKQVVCTVCLAGVTRKKMPEHVSKCTK